jgi:hypothetical protein
LKAAENYIAKFCDYFPGIFREEKLTLQSTQLKCYKIMAVPMLTYASENWTINRSDKKKIRVS